MWLQFFQGWAIFSGWRATYFRANCADLALSIHGPVLESPSDWQKLQLLSDFIRLNKLKDIWKLFQKLEILSCSSNCYWHFKTWSCKNVYLWNMELPTAKNNSIETWNLFLALREVMLVGLVNGPESSFWAKLSYVINGIFGNRHLLI